MYLADYHTHTICSRRPRPWPVRLAEARAGQGWTRSASPTMWTPSLGHATRPGTMTGPRRGGVARRPRHCTGGPAPSAAGGGAGRGQTAPAGRKKLLEAAPQLDFVIGSVHLQPEKSSAAMTCIYTRPKRQAEGIMTVSSGDYLDDVLALAPVGGFTVLGHLTLPLRYFNEMRGLHTSFDPYEAGVREILKTGARKRARHSAERQPGRCPCRTPSGCGSTGNWAVSSSPWAPTPTARSMWAASSGSGRLC